MISTKIRISTKVILCLHMEGKTTQLPWRCGYGTKFDWKEAHYKREMPYGHLPQDCSSRYYSPSWKSNSALRSEGLRLYELPFAFGIFGLCGGGLIVFVVSFLLMLDDVFKGGKDKEWFAQGHRRVGVSLPEKIWLGSPIFILPLFCCSRLNWGGQPTWTMFLLTKTWW